MRENTYQNTYRLPCNAFGTAIVDGNFPASTAYIDVTNYTHFCFVILSGVLDSAMTFQVKQDTDETETASIKNITGATVTVGAGDDNELFVIEVETAAGMDLNNGFRYVTLAVSGATVGEGDEEDFAMILFEGWNVRHRTVTQPSTYPSANAVLIAG